jgi:hypothetical protein
MATNSLAPPSFFKRPALITRWYLNIRYPKLGWLPRKDIVASLLLVLVGMGLPAAMASGLLIASFSLAFLGFALAAVGGVLLLIRCGEI